MADLYVAVPCSTIPFLIALFLIALILIALFSTVTPVTARGLFSKAEVVLSHASITPVKPQQPALPVQPLPSSVIKAR